MFNIEVVEDNRRETLEDLVELARAHYYEVEAKSETVPFNLNVDLLSQMVDLGILSVVVARDEGVLVGYFANMISPDVITSKLISKELGIYLDPSYRGTGVFQEMMSLVEEIAKERGVYSQVLAFKEGHDHGIAEKLGYEKTETLYQKLLEE